MSAAGVLRRNPLLWGGTALVVVALLLGAVAIVDETHEALVLRFGNPVRIANAYRRGERFGDTGAGLIARIPFMEQLVWVDKRVLSFDMQRQAVLSTDQLRLEVDAYARYRIVDPVRMYVAAQNETRVADALKPILGSALRNELGKRPFAALLTPERDVVMGDIRNALARVAAQYGAEIVDVRIKRADLPDGSPLDSAFARMKTARQQQARSIEAEGQRAAQGITGQADADAASIYAASFGKDPSFYDFYRAMQSYKVTFGVGAPALGLGSTAIILSPNNSYLKQFEGKAK